MSRPSHPEILGKLKKAREAVTKKQVALVDSDAILSDLLELDCLAADLPRKLTDILSEIRPEDYQGARPPAKSYERFILECDLFVFKWFSKSFGCLMYFKFAIKGGRLWIVSFHENRAIAGKGGNNGLSE
jgi:hypothetical protein